MLYTTDLADEVTTHSKQNESVVLEIDKASESQKKSLRFRK